MIHEYGEWRIRAEQEDGAWKFTAVNPVAEDECLERIESKAEFRTEDDAVATAKQLIDKRG